ncbi:MAG: enhanced intracellular survival protein Eis [Anaerolineales bacterium]
MNTLLKHLDIEEAIKALHFLSSYAFTPSPPLPDFESYTERIRNRHGSDYFAIIEDGQPQAICCSTTPLTQNLRGKLFTMGGVADVSTHPSARRKGFARRLMHHLFNFFHEKGNAVSCLYPFKESFYERMGYVTLQQTKLVSFNPACLKPIIDQSVPGFVNLVSFREGYNAYLSYLKVLQEMSHGMALFSIPFTELAQKREAWLAFAHQNDQIIGMMNYRLSGEEMHQTLWANDFLFSNAQGKYLLLDWIAKHIDQVEKVDLTIKPELHGEILYTDLSPTFQGRFMAPMARVIGLAALEGLPVGQGEMSIRISDPDCQWNNGDWRFSCDKGSLMIQKDHHQPEFTLTIQGLTALIYGVYDPDEFIFRAWGDPDPIQQNKLRIMFPPIIPFLYAKY